MPCHEAREELCIAMSTDWQTFFFLFLRSWHFSSSCCWYVVDKKNKLFFLENFGSFKVVQVLLQTGRLWEEVARSGCCKWLLDCFSNVLFVFNIILVAAVAVYVVVVVVVRTVCAGCSTSLFVIRLLNFSKSFRFLFVLNEFIIR